MLTENCFKYIQILNINNSWILIKKMMLVFLSTCSWVDIKSYKSALLSKRCSQNSSYKFFFFFCFCFLGDFMCYFSISMPWVYTAPFCFFYFFNMTQVNQYITLLTNFNAIYWTKGCNFVIPLSLISLSPVHFNIYQ